MKKLLIAIAASALVASAGAQARNAFVGVDSISGISVSNVGLTYTVSLDAAPSFDFGGTTYDIMAVIGFWALANGGDVTATAADFNSATGQWDWGINNSDGGGAAGWKTNYAGSANGIDPNGSQAFTFSSLDASTVDQYGFHVVVDGLFPGTSGNTGHITVPEPGTIAALGIGLAVLLARRRKN